MVRRSGDTGRPDCSVSGYASISFLMLADLPNESGEKNLPDEDDTRREPVFPCRVSRVWQNFCSPSILDVYMTPSALHSRVSILMENMAS